MLTGTIWALSAVLLTYLAIPSSLFIKEYGYRLDAVEDGWETTYTRSTPFGGVTIDWATEIILPTQYECRASGVGAFLQPAESPDSPLTVTYHTSPAMNRCLARATQDRTGFVVISMHRVTWGLLRLRPSRTIWACPGVGAPCARA